MCSCTEVAHEIYDAPSSWVADDRSYDIPKRWELVALQEYYSSKRQGSMHVYWDVKLYSMIMVGKGLSNAWNGSRRTIMHDDDDGWRIWHSDVGNNETNADDADDAKVVVRSMGSVKETMMMKGKSRWHCFLVQDETSSKGAWLREVLSGGV